MSDDAPPPRPAAARGQRRLTADEEHLWSAVARTIKPLRPARRPALSAKHKAGGPAKPRATEARPPPMPAATARPRAAPAPPAAIARREKQQLARGRFAIDARIDLHGMTLAQAHGTLLRFLHQAQGDGARFALVITGKGAPNASRGVLRRQVPLWLTLPEFRVCVLGYDVAHVGHGGEGALYVRLRKPRG
jgi:DNA-nicking Smr family endonuclease